MDPSKSGLQEWKARPARDYSKSWLKERNERKAAFVASRSPSPRSKTVSAKRPEVAEPPEHIAAHRDNVWLALGSLALVGGIGLVTAGWLGFIALAAVPAATHPSVIFTVAGLFIIVGGLMMVGFGIYIFLAFFWGWYLPLTSKERADRQERARKGGAIPSIKYKSGEGG